MLSSPLYLHVPSKVIAPALLGRFGCGHDRTEIIPDFHVFSRGEANVPDVSRAAAIQSELVAAGLVPRSLATLDLPGRLFREDLYREALSPRTIHAPLHAE
jgi:NitT/TauT family transport system ATP-binding protein